MILDQRHDPAVLIDAIHEHPKNPRRGDEAAIEASIAAHGFYGAVLVQVKHDDGSPSGDILAGNHRHRMLKRSGEQTIPVLWVDVTDDEALRILLNDNPTSDKGGYDSRGLVELLQNLRNTPVGLIGTGFGDSELTALLAALSVSMPAPGDAPSENPPELWGVVVECSAEVEQVDLLERLASEGYTVRALLS